MSKHTPEPWAIYPETDGTEWCAVDMEPGLPCRQVIAVFSGDNRVANIQRADMSVKAMSGIASAEPGSVKRLAEAAKVLSLADAGARRHGLDMYSDNRLLQAWASLCTALTAIRMEGATE